MKVAKSYFPNVSRLYFANAYGYIDSISGGAGAAKRGYPIILVSGNTINNSLKDYIRSNRINVSYILGGERAVSKAFENSLKNAFGSTVNSNRQRIVEAAYKEIGKPYKFGASGPNSFDCSGLVRYVYRNVTGINLPHNSQLIANAYSNYKVTSIKQMKPGDIVCYGYGLEEDEKLVYQVNGNTKEFTASYDRIYPSSEAVAFYIVPDEPGEWECISINGKAYEKNDLDFVAHEPVKTDDLKVTRIKGDDRYQTALEISKNAYDKAESLVIASGENYPDGIFAGPFANTLNSPLLLTARDQLAPGIREELQRLGTKKST